MPPPPPPPPAAAGWPAVGVVPRLMRDPLGFMKSLSAIGSVVRCRVGPKDMYFVNEPDLVGEALMERTHDFVKAGPYKRRMEPLVGDGLAFLDGASWRRARRMMNPMFSRKSLEGLTPIMVSTIADHLDGWGAYADSGTPFDLSLELAMMTMNVLTSTMFGHALTEEERGRLGVDFRTSNSWINWRVWSTGWPEWAPLPYKRRGSAALARTEATLLRLVEERRNAPEGDDLLSLLVHARLDEDATGFSAKEIRDHAMVLLFAGYETTAVTTTWALALLEQHPAWEEQVVAEVDEVLGGRAPGYADWQELKVTRAAWEEAIRMYPPAFLNGRTATHDCELGGYGIPAGAMVMFNVVGAHYHRDHWNDPERFDPGRFLDGRAASRHRWVCYPFGVGPRTCIALNMATIEAVLGVAMLYQRYRLALVAGADIRPKVRMSIQHRDGPRMRVERRPRRISLLT